MRLLVFLLFPLWAFSQNLKPGVYRDLNADKPLVLGKGEYTFINLEMKDLGKAVWLDGTLHCRVQHSHFNRFG